MTKLTITEAALLVKKSRKTLYRHIEQGKVSASQNDTGEKVIDTSELIRVYGELSQHDNVINKKMSQPETDEKDQKIAILEDKIKQLNLLLEEKNERINDKQEHIDSLKQALILLEYKKEHSTLIQEELTQPPEVEKVTQPTIEPESQIEEVTVPEKPPRKKFLGIF